MDVAQRWRGRGATVAGPGPDGLGELDEGRVRAVLYLCGVGLDALEDGVQQVRLKLLEQPPGKVRDVRAWAATVAANVAADWHRGHGRDRRLVEQLAGQAPPPAPGRSADDTALALSVAAGLRGLPADQRQVLVLRFYVDLTVREIAAELGVPAGTVKSRLHTAVGAMREQLHRLEVV
jgi:RNA polymerase sigma-70 factor (ECF subfamily)